MVMPTRFGAVDEETGARIKERRVRLGMSVKALATHAGVDRGRLAEIEDGATNVRPSTIGAIDSALSSLEEEMGMRDRPTGATTRIGDPADDLIEFTIEGNFGVRAVVKGPVRDLDALQAAVGRLVREMKGDPEPGTDNP
jgi:transcriptional regulator with XRE-family HTH domain